MITNLINKKIPFIAINNIPIIGEEYIILPLIFFKIKGDNQNGQKNKKKRNL